MSIQNLIITNVEAKYNAEYIANVFWNQNIAQVSSITLIPYLKDTEIVQIAYIAIETWCDSEVAYNFIQRLKRREGEHRIVHQSDDWWSVRINTPNNGTLLLGPYGTKYTTEFDSTYFIKEDILKQTAETSQNVTLRAYQYAYVI